MKRQFYILICFICFSLAANAQPPAFVSVVANTPTPARLEKFELTVSLTAAYTNAYDYDDIVLKCVFTAPGGRKDTVEGFYMQDYTLNTSNGNLTANGGGVFKVRYTPTEAGNWQYELSCTNTISTTIQPLAFFVCVAADGKGFIRKNNTNYLGFDNGEQYIPVGENLSWQQGNRYTDYKSWTTKLADNKANFLRLWLCHWGYGIEWKNGYDNFTGLKKYKQSNAYYLDWLLDECKAKGLYMMLCINHHGQVSTTTDANWSDNPYNAANGGPCTNTWDFFTNTTAKAAHKNRLRYIVARWGYSPNIESWELFNEVEWTNSFSTYKTQIKDWHNEMAGYLKSKDVAKHLVTTSYANDVNDPATWNLPDIDFTQTHYYSGAANIETILAGGCNNYVTSFNKPTVNGEFGLSASGSGTLIANDPTGTNLHNSFWATMFTGAMGPASPWYWNDYIDPQNLYYHFKPVSDVAALIPFKDANFKRSSATITSSVVADVSLTPGVGYGGTTAANITINADGTSTPAASQLGQYLFGSVYNTQNRNPPTFTVNYPVAGQFRVNTGGASGTAPTIAIYVDGMQVSNQPAAINSSYTVNIAAGSHTIKVDNLGTDWITISAYTFTNIGSPFNTYILKSADSYRASGWIHNKNYNWQHLKNTGTPATINDGFITIPNLQNGTYTITFYNCSTGLASGTASVPVINGSLSFALPSVTWDVAFTAVEQSALPIRLTSFTGLQAGTKNLLNVDIAHAENVKYVWIERAATDQQFQALAELGAGWASIAGKHQYADVRPLKGANFYRLKIVDKDGSITYSPIVRLVNGTFVFSVYPNPFTDKLTLYLSEGKYAVSMVDALGRSVLQRQVTILATQQQTQLDVAGLQRGIYYMSIKDGNGKILEAKALVK
ncbi:MAG: T9SS type A sorting domain-containing protein [Chitinophagaceae bacterium]